MTRKIVLKSKQELQHETQLWYLQEIRKALRQLVELQRQNVQLHKK